jgi:hypothetical protein
MKSKISQNYNALVQLFFFLKLVKSTLTSHFILKIYTISHNNAGVYNWNFKNKTTRNFKNESALIRLQSR